MERFKKSFLPVLVFAKIDIRRLFRDKLAIFFVFMFPFIFLLIFGSIFNNTSDVSFRIGLFNQADSQAATEFVSWAQDNEMLKIDNELTSLDQAKEKMNRGQLDAAIILPAGYGDTDAVTGLESGQVTVLYNENSASAAQTLASVLSARFEQINQALAPSVTPFSVTTESTATPGLRQFDYTFAGIMGFTLLSLGIFGPISVFPRLKQRGVLRRYHMTSLKVWQYFTGNVLSNALIGLLAISIMFVAAVFIFDLNMRGSYFNLGVVVVFGTVLLFGIGLAIGGWARTENQAAPLGQLATLPMMFLSGVFFPVYLMPELLQRVTQFIPLTPIVDSIRLIVTENASLLDLAPQLGVMAAWAVAIYIVAFRFFRWE